MSLSYVQNFRNMNFSFDNLMDSYDLINMNLKHDISDENKCKIIESILLNASDNYISLKVIIYNDNSIEILGDSTSQIIKSLFEYSIIESFKLSNLFFLANLNGYCYSDLHGKYRRKIKDCKFKVSVLFENEIEDGKIDKSIIEELRKLYYL